MLVENKSKKNMEKEEKEKEEDLAGFPPWFSLNLLEEIRTESVLFESLFPTPDLQTLASLEQ